MPPELKNKALLLDMLDSARAIQDMTTGMVFGAFAGDRRTRRAIERELEIIGEAANKITPEFRDAHPDIPWRKIIAQRHKIAHEYGEILEEIIWRVATINIPELIDFLERLTLTE